MLLVVSRSSERIGPNIETKINHTEYMHLRIVREATCSIEIGNFIPSKAKLVKNTLVLGARITLEDSK